MSLFREQSVSRIGMRVLAVTSIVTAMSIYSIRSCQNKFVRDWDEKEVTVGNANLKTTLTTNRYHDSSNKGKYGSFDELEYKLEVKEQAIDKSRPANFLDSKCNHSPEIYFVNREGVPIVEPIQVQLKPDETESGKWKASGSLPYSNQMRMARDWFLQFDDSSDSGQ